MRNKAFIFDLNGTMIDDMDFHIRAWHAILTSLGAELSVEQVKLECYGKNEELLERIFPGRFSNEEMQVMILQKENTYQVEFKPHLRLIGGLESFLQKAYAESIPMGIGSAALPMNINYVLDGLHIRHYFKSIVSAVDVTISKPHPETFLSCAKQLEVEPENCIVFEDSPKGVLAAKTAGMQCVVLTTMHSADEFEGADNILLKVPDYATDAIIRLINME
jgi:HAD superfamily hydrolase (TIGR01509 family)